MSRTHGLLWALLVPALAEAGPSPLVVLHSRFNDITLGVIQIVTDPIDQVLNLEICDLRLKDPSCQPVLDNPSGQAQLFLQNLRLAALRRTDKLPHHLSVYAFSLLATNIVTLATYAFFEMKLERKWLEHIGEKIVGIAPLKGLRDKALNPKEILLISQLGINVFMLVSWIVEGFVVRQNERQLMTAFTNNLELHPVQDPLVVHERQWGELVDLIHQAAKQLPSPQNDESHKSLPVN